MDKTDYRLVCNDANFTLYIDHMSFAVFCCLGGHAMLTSEHHPMSVCLFGAFFIVRCVPTFH